jgi:hypothetical protein
LLLGLAIMCLIGLMAWFKGDFCHNVRYVTF